MLIAAGNKDHKIAGEVYAVHIDNAMDFSGGLGIGQIDQNSLVRLRKLVPCPGISV